MAANKMFIVEDGQPVREMTAIQLRRAGRLLVHSGEHAKNNDKYIIDVARGRDVRHTLGTVPSDKKLD